ncbi:MAG: FAD-dependent thymidylate synthase [Rickettsiaceae bacterium]
MTKEDELQELLQTSNNTKRATVKALEDILYKPIPVLDHGFIRVVDYMGDDNSIVQAARVSYGRGTKKSLQDKGLINYLMRHRHTTPFEMCDIKFHIKLPIFIARQWIRHRTASVNEYSARYSILSNEFYLPEKIHLSPQSSINKQGRSSDKLPDDVADKVLSMLKNDATNCHRHYIEMMNEDEDGNVIDENTVGITRELARMNLTLNTYTEWYWKINLHNLLHFLALRADSHAQYEIRAYANAMLDVVKIWVPFAYEAFEEHRINGTTISRKGMEVIKQMIAGKNIDQESSGMSKREWAELMQALDK